jgi:hypothetical protein
MAGLQIELLERVGQDWFRGRLNGSEGIFPAAFVEVLQPLPEATAPSNTAAGFNATKTTSPVTGEAEAVFDYDSEVDGDLAFRTGDCIALLSRQGQDWYLGQLRDKQGLFPANFVRILRDLP